MACRSLAALRALVGATTCGVLFAGMALAQAPGEALVKAAARGDLAAVTAQIAQGTSVDAPDKDGNTALMEAARTGKSDVVAALIKTKANLNATNKDGWTAAMRAVFGGQAATLEALAKAGAKLDLANNKGQTALDVALQFTGDARPGLFPVLAEAGADVKGATVKGQPALIHAVNSLQDGMMTGLLKAGADPDVKDAQGRPAIVLAASHSTLDNGVKMVAALVAAKANLNARDSRGRSALEYAVDVSKADYGKANLRKNAGVVVYALSSRGADEASVAAARTAIFKNGFVLFDTMIVEGRKKAMSASAPAPAAPAGRAGASGAKQAAGPPPAGCPAASAVTKLASTSPAYAASQPIDIASIKSARALVERNGAVVVVFLTNRGFTAAAMNSDMVVPVKAQGDVIVKLRFMNGATAVGPGTFTPAAGWGKPGSVAAETVVTGGKPSGTVVTLAAAQGSDTGKATISAMSGGYVCGSFDVKGGLGETAGTFVAVIEK